MLGVTEIYSKRLKKLKGNAPEVYRYDKIPRSLKVQINYIWRDSFGEDLEFGFQDLHSILLREYGRLSLVSKVRGNYASVANFMLDAVDTNIFLDVVELSFKKIDTDVRNHGYKYPGTKITPDDAIAELNARFKEHRIGYQYESGQIVRIDSQLIHSEVVKPALLLLTGDVYRGANEEFLSAHKHYRDRKYKECLNDCLKSFESVMKVICDKRGWNRDENATAKRLLEIIFENGLIPEFMQSHFSGLRATLEAGVPTVRNRLGGHGQGEQPKKVPEYVASYALHLTASNIVFLVASEEEM